MGEVQYLRLGTTRRRVPSRGDLRTRNPYRSTSKLESGFPTASAASLQKMSSACSRRNSSTVTGETSSSSGVTANACSASLGSTGAPSVQYLGGVFLLPSPLYRETRDLVANRFGAGTLNSGA